MNTEKLFLSESGDLLKTSDCSVLREKYSYHFREIENTLQLRATIRAGRYSWPGCYEIAFITSDGGVLCHDCAKTEYKNIADSIRRDIRDGWHVVGAEIMDHCEDDEKPHCDHCNSSFD